MTLGLLSNKLFRQDLEYQVDIGLATKIISTKALKKHIKQQPENQVQAKKTGNIAVFHTLDVIKVFVEIDSLPDLKDSAAVEYTTI